MPFNGSGVFQRVRNWVADAAAGIKIRADYHDAEDDGFAAGLTNCITRDGQTVITQNIPFNSKRITGLADPVNPQDAATKASVATQVTSSALPLTGGTITGNLAVNGTTTLTGDLNVSGSITSTPTSLNSMRHASQTYGVFSHFNDVNYYLMCTNVNDRYGSFNSLRPLTMNASTGNIVFGHNITVGLTLTVNSSANIAGALTVQGVPVYGDIPVVPHAGEGFGTNATHVGKMICQTGGTPCTMFITGSIHPVGTVISFFNHAASYIVIGNNETMMWRGPSGPVTGSRNLQQYGVCTAHKWTGGYWLISGNGLT